MVGKAKGTTRLLVELKDCLGERTHIFVEVFVSYEQEVLPGKALGDRVVTGMTIDFDTKGYLSPAECEQVLSDARETWTG